MNDGRKEGRRRGWRKGRRRLAARPFFSALVRSDEESLPLLGSVRQYDPRSCRMSIAHVDTYIHGGKRSDVFFLLRC